MPTAIEQLIIDVRATTSSAEAGLMRVSNSLKGLSKGAVGATANVLIPGFTDFDKQITAVGKSLTWKLSLPLGIASAGAIKLAGDMEQTKIAFTTMLGSAEEANGFIGEMREFAKTTPFQFTDLTTASKRMLAFGFASKEVLPMLTNIGDASAALGLGAEGLNRVTTAIGQIQAKGRVQAQEMLQLTEAGIPAWEMLATAMGKTTAEVMKLSEQGAISSEVAIAALMQGMQSKFGGLMAAQSKTFLGQLSNLIDAYKIELTRFGEAMLPFAKVVLKAMQMMVSVLALVPKPVLYIAAAFTVLAIALGPALIALVAITKYMMIASAFKWFTGLGPITFFVSTLKAVKLGLMGVSAAQIQVQLTGAGMNKGTAKLISMFVQLGGIVRSYILQLFGLTTATATETAASAANTAATFGQSAAVVQYSTFLGVATVETEVATVATTKFSLSQIIAAGATRLFNGALKMLRTGLASLRTAIAAVPPPIMIAVLAITAIIVVLTELYYLFQKKYELKIEIQESKIEGIKSDMEAAISTFGILSKEYKKLQKELQQAIIVKVELENKKEWFNDLGEAITGGNIFEKIFRSAGGPIGYALSYGKALIETSAAQKSFNEGYKKTIDLMNQPLPESMEKARADLFLMESNIAELTKARQDMDRDPAGQRMADAKLQILKDQESVIRSQIQAQEALNKEVAENMGLYRDSTREAYILAQAKSALGIALTPGVDIGTGIGSPDPLTGDRIGTEQQLYALDLQNKIKELQEGLKKDAMETAEVGASLVGTLKEIPKNIDKVLSRDWGAISGRIKTAVDEFNSGWANVDKATMDAVTERAASIAAIAGSLGTALQVLADMPKKVLNPVRQNYAALSNLLNSATDEIMKTLEVYSDEMLTTKSARMENVANVAGSLGSMLQALADMPKKYIKPVQQGWATLGLYMLDAMKQLLKVFQGQALAEQAEKMGPIGDIAGGIGSFIQALADMPKKFVKVSPQDWYALGDAVDSIMDAIMSVFESVGTKTLSKNAERLSSVGSMAGSISSMVTAFADITSSVVKKALVGISAVRKNVKTLATEMSKMIKDFMAVLSGKGVTISEKSSGGYDRLFGMVTSISDVITSFSELTVSKIDSAIVSLNRAANKAPALGRAMVKIIKALQKSFTGLKISESFASLSERVVSMTTDFGDVIKNYAEITKEMIDEAVVGLKATATAAPALGAAMLGLISALRNQFKSLMKDKKFGSFADIADRVTTVTSSIADVITTFATITKDLIDTAVAGLKEAAKQAPLLGRAMVDLVNSLGEQFSKAEIDDAVVTLTGQITGTASQIGDILTQFAELSEDSIDKAIASLKYVASHAADLAAALVQMALALQAAFSDAGVNKAFADSMDDIGRVMGNVSSVFSFATSMTDENKKILEEFAADSTILYSLWNGVGTALTFAIQGLVDSLQIIPDAGQLAIAEKAISSLSAIFSSLTGLMDSVGAARSWTVDMRNPAVQEATMGTGAAIFAPIPPEERQSQSSMDVHIDVSWSTLTGEPSAREKRQLVSYIEPEMKRLANNMSRGGF